MRKTLILVLAQFLFIASGCTQKQEVYFLATNPGMHLDLEQYLSLLYKIQNDSLSVHDTLTTGNNMMSRFIRVYHEKGYTFYHEEGFLRRENNLKVLAHDDLNQVNIITNYSDDIHTWPSSVLKEKTLLYNAIFEGDKDTIRYFAFDSDLVRYELAGKDFGRSYIVGYPGAPIKNLDIQSLIASPDDGKLKMALTRDIAKRPIFPFELPKEYWPREKRRMQIYIHTDQVVLMKINQTRGEGAKLGQSNFILFNKMDQSWSELNIEGNRTRVQSFGNWITGSIAEVDESRQRVSPGVETRKRKPDIYGPGFDVMTRVLGLYYPGKLFLYNIHTEKYIEWTTDQGDSEVLLIYGDKLVYRVDNRIYQSEIINGDILSEPTLMIEDSRARDIHWSFLGRG